MTLKEAYKVLEVKPGSDIKEVKKKYRKLMHRLHPDVHTSSEEHYSYNVQEINTAYSILKKKLEAGEELFSERQRTAPRPKRRRWNGPVNEYAYRERDIFCYAEDQEGKPLGMFSVDRGKYLWRTEEEFPLFLRSVYQCGKEILDEIDQMCRRSRQPVFRFQIQAQLTYLLAQQFIDGTAMLKELAQETGADPEGNLTFYIAAMLEPTAGPVVLREQENLYPSRLKDHRLYLKNGSGQELGYVSFPDDRLYYVLVPLFEQRRVQVRIQAAREEERKKGRKKAAYRRIHLWLKLPVKNEDHRLENLNMQIEQLLKKYRLANV